MRKLQTGIVSAWGGDFNREAESRIQGMHRWQDVPKSKVEFDSTVSTHGNYLGKEFADVVELKRILSADIRPFARNLIIRIAEYAKGRKLVAADYATVQQLVDESAKNSFKFNDMVRSIATSNLMTNR